MLAPLYIGVLVLHNVHLIGEGYFGNVYEAKAFGIFYPGVWSTVAVKMARGIFKKMSPHVVRMTIIRSLLDRGEREVRDGDGQLV